MSRFNTKATGVQPTETNFMGEKAYKMGDKEELVSTVMTTFLSDSYYEGKNVMVERICEILSKVDPLFAAKLAIYARNEGNLRSVTHLIAAELPKYTQGCEWAKRFYNKIVVRPDDMSEILSAYASRNGMDLKDIHKIPNSIKKGFKIALERLDAYQIDKYKMKRRNVSLVDLVRLFHPKGTQKNSEAYKRLVNGESLAELYSSKVFEKEMSKAGQNSKNMTQEEIVEAKKVAIENVLDNIDGMPIMNLLRNLRNILLYAPNKVDEACRQLRIEKKILNSRLLPFRFATAYEEIEKMTYDFNRNKKETTLILFESETSSIKLTKQEFNQAKRTILDAIEDALEISCQNIPVLEGKTAILCDDSGSMRGDRGGSSQVSAFSSVNTSMIGHLFASMMAYRQNDVYVGLFGDKLVNVPFERNKKLLDFNKWSYELGEKCGGATEGGIYEFFRQVIKENKKIDNIIVFSDCQIGDKNRTFTSWYGTDSNDRGEHFHELFNKFKKINPMMNFVVVNLRQSGHTSVFDKSQRILNIAGWSDKIFDVITSNCKGFDAMIKEIEAIEI